MKSDLSKISAICFSIIFLLVDRKIVSKPFTPANYTVYYYIASVKVIAHDAVGGETTIPAYQLEDAQNWSDEPCVTPQFAAGRRLNAICFNQSVDQDANIDDGDLTLQQAISAVKNRYTASSPGNLPINLDMFSVGALNPSVITIYRMAN